MKLKDITLITLIGISYIFISRTAATLAPSVFQQQALAVIHLLLSLLATAAGVLFFVRFGTDYAAGEYGGLDRSARLMAAAAAGVSFLHLLNLLKVTGIFDLESEVFYLIFPWAYSAGAVYFFYLFLKEAPLERDSGLRRILVLVLATSVLSALIRTALLVNFLNNNEFKWLWDYAARMPYIFFPLQGLIFIARFMFYLAFYRDQD